MTEGHSAPSHFRTEHIRNPLGGKSRLWYRKGIFESRFALPLRDTSSSKLQNDQISQRL